MSEDKKFANKVELENWLKERGIDDEDDAVEAADKLFEKKFNKPSRLLGITIEMLARAGIGDALALELNNKLVPKQIDHSATISSALNRIETKLDDMATDDVPMSEATLNFTASMLGDMRIKVHVQEVNKETGGRELQQYEWGEKESEASGQPGCQKILQEEIFPLTVDGEKIEMYDVRNRALPELKAGKRKSKGFSDIAFGPKSRWIMR